jgi:hypothetical protein
MTGRKPNHEQPDAPSNRADGDLPVTARDDAGRTPELPRPAVEIGGRKGPDPTRYGDWEKNGRCIDF